MEKLIKSGLGLFNKTIKQKKEWKWGSILELVNIFEKIDPSKIKVKFLRILKIHLAKSYKKKNIAQLNKKGKFMDFLTPNC